MYKIEFERIVPEAVGINSSDIMRLLDRLEDGTKEPHSLIIMKQGQICAEGYWNPFAPGIVHGQQSHTKTYAATAVGIAYTQSILQLEDKIIDIFKDEAPKQPSENLKKLTVHDVLCMGCGMREMPDASSEWIREFLNIPVVDCPGTVFFYNSVGSTLLGAIIRKLTGYGLHQYLKKELFDKIGIDANGLKWLYTQDGLEFGGGGLYATTEDNLRLMKLYADGGIWNGEQILSADYIKKATGKQIDTITEKEVNPNATDNFHGYGYQLWMCGKDEIYRADGAMGQFTIVDPKNDMIIAYTGTASGAHWAQSVLDDFGVFIESVSKSKLVLGVNEVSDRLQNRMRRLSLENPAYAPYSKFSESINDKEYRVVQGILTFDDLTALTMAGGVPCSRIEKFAFHFEDRKVYFRYSSEGTKQSLEVAINGTRAWNNIRLETSPVSIVLANGTWAGENTFNLCLRLLETCSERTYEFTFCDDSVGINIRSNTAFDLPECKNAKAICEEG